MRYMFVLTAAPDAWDGAEPQDGVFDDWALYTRALHDAGVLVEGEGLHPADTATSVRVRNNERLLTDGPFATTKEQLIGYYVVDCADLDVALDWAAKCPNAGVGTVEVRPILPNTDSASMLGAETTA